jgi:hypothetical protein
MICGFRRPNPVRPKLFSTMVSRYAKAYVPSLVAWFFGVSNKVSTVATATASAPPHRVGVFHLVWPTGIK